jgi:hypothetical protein
MNWYKLIRKIIKKAKININTKRIIINSLNKNTGLFDNRPIKTQCCICEKIKTDDGWQILSNLNDYYISHTFCPSCQEEYLKKNGLT